MRAAILEQPHSRIPVRDLEIQQPREGEVLMDVVAAGVCHSDYHLIDGHMQPWGLPWVLGHEGAGVVREVGPGVSSVAPGDKIILSLDAMCGYCRNCSLGSPALCETHVRVPVTRMTLDGNPTYHFRPTFAEQTIALADACVKVPDDTNLHAGSLVSCGVITGIRGSGESSEGRARREHGRVWMRRGRAERSAGRRPRVRRQDHCRRQDPLQAGACRADGRNSLHQR